MRLGCKQRIVQVRFHGHAQSISRWAGGVNLAVLLLRAPGQLLVTAAGREQGRILHRRGQQRMGLAGPNLSSFSHVAASPTARLVLPSAIT